MKRTLDEILQSTSDVLFPAELGEAKVDVASTDCDGDTPLHVLVWRNDVEGVLLLIENGADVNAVGDMGETPLHVAISQKNQKIIAALLAAGARTDLVSEFGATALTKAKMCGVKLKGNT